MWPSQWIAMDIHGTNFKFVPYLKIKIIGEGECTPLPFTIAKEEKRWRSIMENGNVGFAMRYILQKVFHWCNAEAH